MSSASYSIAFFANPAGKHNLKWIRRIAAEHQVILLCTENIAPETWLTDGFDGPIYPLLPALYPHSNPLKRKAIVRQLRQVFEKHRIDIAHSMYAYPHAYYPWLLRFPRHVITTRGSDVLVDYQQTFSNPENWKQRLAYRQLQQVFEKTIASASAITSTSKRQQEVLRQLTDPAKLHLIRTGVPVDELQAAAKKHDGAPKGNFRIFSPRAMAPLYNQDLIVQAFQLLCEHLPNEDLELVLIDDRPGTPYAQKVRDLVQSLNLESRVSFVPQQNLEGLVQLYMEAQVVVMLPQSDGTPNTALESMILRRPLVMGAIGYDDDLFSPEAVWRTEEDTPLALKNTLLKVLQASEKEQAIRSSRAFECAYEGAALSESLRKINQIYNRLMI
ncbi:MAG: glycosyltransferase family 4 protein [Salibacteraceae bacterium]